MHSNVRNKSTTKFKTKSRGLSLIINEIENLTPNVISYKINFTQDKGVEWIIMDKNYYLDQIVKQHLLSNVYKEVSVDSDKKVFKNLKKH